MVAVAARKDAEAGGLADRALSGAEWSGKVFGGVCADQSAHLLGNEQCSGGGAGVDRGGDCGDGGGAERAKPSKRLSSQGDRG